MKIRIFFIGFVLVLIFSIISPAFAQVYAFRLDKEIVHVMWQSNGSLSLGYEFVFSNETYADPIDFVDVSMPVSDFSPSNGYAEIDGIQITHIKNSEYVNNAIELGLGANAIRPGSTGIVKFWIDGIDDVLYIDSTDDSYASAVFSPTWFDSDFVSGFTELTIIFHLPPGVAPDEPRWHQAPSGWDEEPITGHDEEGRITYTWHNETANAHTQYLFGASFPAQYVPAGSISDPSEWQSTSTGSSDFLLGLSIFGCIFLFIIGIPILAVIGQRNRKLKYLSPKIAIEGHGIKRGLTAIEAAILLEQPMDKILTMILFAVIKKGAASVIKRQPLTLDITDPLPPNLKGYENDFLEAMAHEGKAKRRKALQQTMIKLVKSVSRAMKGFSRRETRVYYKDIIERAWAQVEASDTPEIRSEKYDEVMEWTMLDKDYDDRTRRVFDHYPVFIPTWWHRYDPAPSRPANISRQSSRSVPGGTGMPHLPGSDFAASVVNGVQGFASGVIGNVSDFTSGITQKTNPIPKSSSGGYRSSGGSSCACACACAGCACACAGGGR